MNTLEIGTATIEYGENGVVTNADFAPTLKLDCKDLLPLLKVVPNDTPEHTKHQAEVIFGYWFSKMNEVELADRDKYEVASEKFECELYPNGKVRKCKIKFIFKEI